MAMSSDIQLGLANRFVVTVDGGPSLGSWAQATGLEVSWDYAEYRSGEDWNHRWFFPGMTKYPTVKLTRSADATDTPLVKKWLDDTSKAFKPATLTIELRDAHNKEVFKWTCKNAVPLKWSVAGFDATSAKVALETLELTHLGFLDDEQK
jgi:phage tail-like protein